MKNNTPNYHDIAKRYSGKVLENDSSNIFKQKNVPLLFSCLCGKPPELLRRLIDQRKVNYYYYACPSCEILTFSTRKEEFCRELWNSTIKLKLQKKAIDKNTQKK